MSSPTAFILGLLVGGFAQWMIRRIYWRRRVATLQPELENNRQQPAKLVGGDAASSIPLAGDTPPNPDDLKAIKGIGPVIAKMLNQAGIYTFQDLAALTPESLRAILGVTIQRLANEERIIQQARELGLKADRGT